MKKYPPVSLAVNCFFFKFEKIAYQKICEVVVRLLVIYVQRAQSRIVHTRIHKAYLHANISNKVQFNVK